LCAARAMSVSCGRQVGSDPLFADTADSEPTGGASVLLTVITREPIMAVRGRLLAAVISVGLAIAPAGHAEDRHGHGHPNHHGNNVGAAIVGGLIGLGIGAAIASGSGYYAPPPPVYYGAPPGYYGPPPAVYYGY